MNSHMLFELVILHEAELRERDARRAALNQYAATETVKNPPGAIRRWIASVLVRAGERLGEIPSLPHSRTESGSPFST
jgi:hypothetical protein